MAKIEDLHDRISITPKMGHETHSEIKGLWMPAYMYVTRTPDGISEACGPHEINFGAEARKRDLVQYAEEP
jgi:hypothetical protein